MTFDNIRYPKYDGSVGVSVSMGVFPVAPSSLCPENGEPGLGGALGRLVEGVERGLTSAHSRRAYRASLLHFLGWCGRMTPAPAFSRLTVLQYKDELIGARTRDAAGGEQRRFAPATVNQRLAAVRALAQEAADADLLAQSEAAAIRRVRGERSSGSRIGNWLRKEEVDAVLRSIDRTIPRGRRDYAMLAVLFATGLRRRELVELEVSAMQERDGQWGLIGIEGKGGRVRNISLPGWVRRAILDWLEWAGIEGGPIFRRITRQGQVGAEGLSAEAVKIILSHSMSPLGFQSFRPHDARRTCARLCRAGAASLEDVQELLGHSSVQTTERYLGKTDGFKRAITDLITEPRG